MKLTVALRPSSSLNDVFCSHPGADQTLSAHPSPNESNMASVHEVPWLTPCVAWYGEPPRSVPPKSVESHSSTHETSLG